MDHGRNFDYRRTEHLLSQLSNYHIYIIINTTFLVKI